jgi:hypothetical protein
LAFGPWPLALGSTATAKAEADSSPFAALRLGMTNSKLVIHGRPGQVG